MSQRRTRTGFTLVELMIVISLISILALVGTVNMVRARSRGQYTGCISNLKNIATALNMRANDYQGRFPTTLRSLTPTYLKVIPSCPAGGYDTYISNFTSRSNPDVYTVICGGNNHGGAGRPANFPQYTQDRGLIE